MYFSILIPVFLSVTAVLLLGKPIMRFLSRIGVIGTDQHKQGKPVLPSSGGTIAAAGFFIGILSFVGISTFATKISVDLAGLLAAIIAIETITLVGFLDDLYTKKVKMKARVGHVDYRVGLKQWQKPLLVLPAAIPLMAVNIGHQALAIPFLGIVDFGLLYPLLLVPLALVCVSNATNMLAGLNGLEAGMGAVALVGMGIFALTKGSVDAAGLALVGAASLFAFLRFNWYPARVLPGDSLTYMIGALIASVAIIGNMEKFAIIAFVPWIAEAFLKAKGMFRGTSLARLERGNYLKPKNGKIESLTHVIMSLGNLKENQLVLSFVLLEAFFVALAFFFSA